jgi:hypothetical protein
MNIIAILLACHLFTSPLPTPTPNLGEAGQQLNFALLKDGLVGKMQKVYGRTYTVRKLKTIQILYNDKGHVICIFQTIGLSEISLGEIDPDPLISEDIKAKTKMDGVTYSIRTKTFKKSAMAIIYNEKDRAIFSISFPGMISILMPAGEETLPSLDPM